MEVSLDDIDIERLREDLKDYFIGAMFNASPVAVVDVTEVETASAMKVVQIALDNGFDLSRYINGNIFSR